MGQTNPPTVTVIREEYKPLSQHPTTPGCFFVTAEGTVIQVVECKPNLTRPLICYDWTRQQLEEWDWETEVLPVVPVALTVQVQG